MKFDFSGLEKNKNLIIILLAMIIVCGGSLLGVKSMTASFQTQTDVVTTTQPTLPVTTMPPVTTTAPTTTEPTTTTTTETTTTTTTTETTTTTVPSTSDQNLITTFHMDNTTTIPTTMPTMAPTTTTERVLTLPSLQLPSTTASSGSSNGVVAGLVDGLKPNGTLFDDGIASYQYNQTGNYYYTNEDPWQRALGYNELYDNGAAFVAIYIDTMRCKFRYDNKDWMIQFWKGQYGYVFIGHEIGVYYKPAERTTEHYDCVSDEDSLYMEMNGVRNGEILYHRDYGKYWWCTGFVPGKLKKFSDRSELTIDCRITMKDKEMLGAFVGSLDKNGMIKNEDYKVKGLDVYIVW